jgi:DMSO reductase family type II enzyme heme b subunit
MQAHRVSQASEAFAAPESPLWASQPVSEVTLAGVPLGLQPTAYIVASRQQRPVGRVTQVRVQAVHDGREVAFRLEWRDGVRNLETSDNDVFPDGAALLFALHREAPLVSMGAEGQPVNAWHWRADRPGRGLSNVATGLGTTRVTDESEISAAADWEGGRWALVFRRTLRVPGGDDEVVQFSVGQHRKLAFAVWEGANGERAGLKAFSPEWHELVLEA